MFFRHRTNNNLSFAPELIQINKQRSSWRVTYNVTKLIEMGCLKKELREGNKKDKYVVVTDYGEKIYETYVNLFIREHLRNYSGSQIQFQKNI